MPSPVLCSNRHHTGNDIRRQAPYALGMRYTYALSALRHKRARLAGEIEATERTLAKRREELAAIDATLRLFHPDADPSHITSIRPVWRGIYFRQGERPRLCLDALRDAGKPLPTAQITAYVMRAKGMDAADRKLRAAVHGHIHRAMSRLAVQGRVRRILSEPPSETWWELVA